tara:strand:+ start:264 stop:1160 length:897 start_codon:yes stop_codon:yes gene_type:complete
MQKVILQPSQPDHFQNTIQNGVPLNETSDFLSKVELSDLKKIYGDAPAHIWGLVAGKSNVNVSKWDKIDEGDLVFFIEKGYVIYISRVVYKARNESLALTLWGKDSKNQTWEYLYFLEKGTNENIDLNEITPLLGYKDNFILYGVMVLSTEKSKTIIDSYGDLDNMLELVQSDYSKPRKDDIDYIRKQVTDVATSLEATSLLNDMEEHLETVETIKKYRIAKALARNTKLAQLIKEKAQYKCEICGIDGFEKRNGGKYAEVHHKDELGAGGKDLPSNMICVCPTCHRKIHFGKELPTI